MRRLIRAAAVAGVAGTCLVAAAVTPDPRSVAAAGRAGVPVIADVVLEYDPATPEWVWATVTCANLDPADPGMLFVTRLGPAADLGDGRIWSKDDYEIKPDGTVYVGLWLPEPRFPGGVVPIELHLASGGRWSEPLTIDVETFAARTARQTQAVAALSAP